MDRKPKTGPPPPSGQKPKTGPPPPSGQKPKTGPPPPSGQKPKTGPPPPRITPEYKRRQESIERVAKKKARIEALEKDDPNYWVKVITSGLNERYEIIDSVFAMDSHAGGFLSTANPEKAFVGVKKQLRQKALEIGGNAVINCSFEYRVAVGDGLLGAKQVMEIFAYGTVVKIW
tara:strand:- start:222 stop:743 length:522 start_codon:yes stop_codon:yes gene_type:complete